jgi:hypothetical protein
MFPSYLYWKFQLGKASKSIISSELAVLSASETLDYLFQEKSSFARFGEGELRLAFSQGQTIYDDYNFWLSKRLREVLQHATPNLLVGFNSYFESSGSFKMINSLVREGKVPNSYETIHLENDVGVFHRPELYEELRRYRKHIDFWSLQTRLGEASAFTKSIYLQEYETNEMDLVEEKIHRLFNCESMLLIAPSIPNNGPSLATKFKNNSWGVGNLETLEIPPRNAYQKHSQIMHHVEKTCGQFDLVVIQGGALATILTKDITEKFNLRTLDVGGFTN